MTTFLITAFCSALIAWLCCAKSYRSGWNDGYALAMRSPTATIEHNGERFKGVIVGRPDVVAFGDTREECAERLLRKLCERGNG